MAIKPVLKHTFYKNDGTRNAGGKVWTYEAGTTTPKTTHTTSVADVANTNPIILDSHGECELWSDGQLKVNNLESDDTQVTGWPVDNVGSGVSNNDANARWAGTAGGSANALTISPSPAITAYAAGQSFIFKSGANANTAATTIAISGLAAIAVQSNGAACSGGEILADKWYQILLSTTAICQISKIGEPTLSELGAAALTGAIFTGLVNLAEGANIASAATVDLTAATGNTLQITGTVATSAITMNAGQQMLCIANGAWPLTYHATTNRIDTGGVDYTCTDGDAVLYYKTVSTVYGHIIKKHGSSILSNEDATAVVGSTTIDTYTDTANSLALTSTGRWRISWGGGITITSSGGTGLCLPELTLTKADNTVVKKAVGHAVAAATSQYLENVRNEVVVDITTATTYKLRFCAATFSGTPTLTGISTGGTTMPTVITAIKV